MPNICFVTNELYPKNSGGIGRLMFNFAVFNRDSSKERARLFFLLPFESAREFNESVDFYRDNDLGEIVFCPQGFGSLGTDVGATYALLNTSYSFESYLRTSLHYMCGLNYLEHLYGIKLDFIEFPDYGGWGYSTIMAKQSGISFTSATIVVRLHSTAGIIRKHEQNYHIKDDVQRYFYELERESIANADLVVSHLDAITDANADAYSFGDKWRSSVALEFPPILLDSSTEGSDICSPEDEPDFLFSSRLQPFKRPDTFIRAAIEFLSENSAYKGSFIIASYGWDERYISFLNQLIPLQLRTRIKILTNCTAGLRDYLIRRSVVVIPSDYESLCVFAYECAIRGVKLVLNGACAAFGQGAYWREGLNCTMFDGTASGLALAMKRAISDAPPVPKALPEYIPYWLPEQLRDRIVTPASKASSDKSSLAIPEVDAAPSISVLMLFPKSLDEIHKFTLTHGESLLTGLIRLVVVIGADLTCEEALPKNDYVRIVRSNQVSVSEDLLSKLPEFIDGSKYFCLSYPHISITPSYFSLASSTLDRNSDIQACTSFVGLLRVNVSANGWEDADRDALPPVDHIRLPYGSFPSLLRTGLPLLSLSTVFRAPLLTVAKESHSAEYLWAEAWIGRLISERIPVTIIPLPLIFEGERSSQPLHISSETLKGNFVLEDSF